MVVNENENYRLILLKPERPSNTTIITFDFFEKQKDFREPVEFTDFSDTNFITQLGFNNIKVQTRRNDWYQLEGAMELFQAINAKKGDDDIFITYGMSMGATAAINFSEVIGADYFIALAPQASLDSNYMDSISDNRWKKGHEFYHNDFLLNNQLRTQKGLVIVDPSSPLDYQHAKTIQQYSSAQLINFLGVGHFPGKALVSGPYTLKDVITDVVEALTTRKIGLDEIYLRIDKAISEHVVTKFFKMSSLEKITYIVNNDLSFITMGVIQSLIFQIDSKSEEGALNAFICFSMAKRFGKKQQNWISRELSKKGFINLSENL